MYETRFHKSRRNGAMLQSRYNCDCPMKQCVQTAFGLRFTQNCVEQSAHRRQLYGLYSYLSPFHDHNAKTIRQLSHCSHTSTDPCQVLKRRRQDWTTPILQTCSAVRQISQTSRCFRKRRRQNNISPFKTFQVKQHDFRNTCPCGQSRRWFFHQDFFPAIAVSPPLLFS